MPNWRHRQFYGDWLGRGSAWLFLITSLPGVLALVYAMTIKEMAVLPGIGLSLVLAYGILIGAFWLITNRKRNG